MLVPLAERVLGSSLNRLIEATYWLWPVLEILHFIGLSLLMGSLIIIDLRLAGHIRQLKLDSIFSLMPVAWAGFGLNLLTGILFFYGDPMRYAVNIGFHVKMVLILLAGLNMLLFAFLVKPGLTMQADQSPTPSLTKGIAYASLTLWGGVLLCGRLIPYVGTG